MAASEGAAEAEVGVEDAAAAGDVAEVGGVDELTRSTMEKKRKASIRLRS